MAANGNEIKATVRLEGGTAFKKEISDVNSSMKQLDAESKNISSTFEGQANSLEALTAKQQNLAQMLDLAERKVSLYSDRIQSLKTQQESIAASTEKYRDELKQAQEALSKMDKGSDAYEKQARAVDALANKVQLGEQNQARANSQIEKYRLEQTKAETAVQDLNHQIDRNAQYLNEAENSADKCATSIDEYGRKTKQAADESKGLGDVTKVALGNLAAEAATRLADAAADAVRALAEAGRAAAAYADEILTASTVTGLSTDTLQEYAYAAELIDTDLADVEKALGKNVKSMASAQSGSEAYAEAYQKLGVSVTDANGNLRSSEDVFWECIDALGNVKNETEADAIAMQIFGKSARDLNPLIEAGSDGFRKFADEAHEAGAVLNGDTLDSLGKVDDSLQRLDSQVSAFKNAAGASIAPLLGSLAEGATALLKAMTNAFTPPENSDLQNYLQELNGDIEETQQSLENIGKVELKAEADVSEIEQYREVLQKATTDEELSEFEKYQLQKAVESLGDSIPGLRDAYDEETSSINLTTEAVDKLLDSMEKQIRQQAYADTLEAAYKAQGEAALEAVKAQSAYTQSIEELKNALSDVPPEILDTFDFSNLSGEDLASLNDIAADYGVTLGTLIDTLVESQNAFDKASEAEKEAAKIAGQTESAYKKLTGTASETNNAANKKTEATKDSTKAQEEENKAMTEGIPIGQGYVNMNRALFDTKVKTKETTEENTEAIEKETAAWDLLGGYLDQAKEGVADFVEKTDEWAQEGISEKIAERAKASAEAEKAALETTRQAYEDNYNSIKDTLSQKLSLWDAFDGGEDVTVEQMIANLQSQNEGITQYKQEMEEVIATYGDELGPDLINTLQSMGTDAANTWHHMWVTMQQDNAPELFAQMGQEWTAGLDLADQIATYCAGNLTAYQLATGQMGSTKIEWTGLRESVNEMTPELDAAIQAAQAAGVAIPDGLAEGLASGETSTASAVEQITSSLQGTFQGLYEIAQQSGADIPAGLSEGIDGSAESYQAAINTLTESLSQAGNEAGTTAAEEISTGLETKAGDVKSAAETTAKSAADAAKGKKSDFNTAGGDAAGQYAQGVNSKKSQATSAGREIAQAAVTGAKGKESEFRSVGQNMAGALAAGIRAGQSSAINAAVNMAVEAYQRAKAAIGQHSPTGIFKDELGKNVPLAFAAGIKENQNRAEKAAANMAQSTYNAAQFVSSVNGMDQQSQTAPSVTVDTSPIARMIGRGMSSPGITNYFDIHADNPQDTANEIARTLKMQLRMA